MIVAAAILTTNWRPFDKSWTTSIRSWRTCISQDHSSVSRKWWWNFTDACPFGNIFLRSLGNYELKYTIVCWRGQYNNASQVHCLLWSWHGPRKRRAQLCSTSRARTCEGLHRRWKEHITGDNFFSSHSLVSELLDSRTTYLGTIRANKRELPPASKSVVNRSRGDVKHFYSDKVVLASFWDKGTKPVLLWSSMHGPQVDVRGTEEKPPIVADYNHTKTAVDNLNKLVRTYSSKRKCRRWPYSIAMTLVDVAIIASHKLMQSQTGSTEDHYTFKRELSYELCRPIMARRLQRPNRKRSVCALLANMNLAKDQQCHGADDVPPHPSSKASKPGRCSFCPRQADRKTRILCGKCSLLVCHEDSSTRCPNCVWTSFVHSLIFLFTAPAGRKYMYVAILVILIYGSNKAFCYAVILLSYTKMIVSMIISTWKQFTGILHIDYIHVLVSW